MGNICFSSGSKPRDPPPAHMINSPPNASNASAMPVSPGDVTFGMAPVTNPLMPEDPSRPLPNVPKRKCERNECVTPRLALKTQVDF